MIIKSHLGKINEPIKVSLLVLEINFMELAMLTLSLFIVTLLCGFINVYVNVFGIFFFLWLVGMYLPLLFFLAYSNKQDHPQFLLSLISFLFFQPRRINFLNPKHLDYGR